MLGLSAWAVIRGVFHAKYISPIETAIYRALLALAMWL